MEKSSQCIWDIILMDLTKESGNPSKMEKFFVWHNQHIVAK